MDRQAILECRSRLIQAMRHFFFSRGFVEVETPVRIVAPALESHIDAEPAGTAYLRTSPELHMKRLLAEGMPRLFQIGPCFRRGECGARHQPEFTMLEWYRSEADYLDILVDTKALIAELAATVLGRTSLSYQGRDIDLLPAWHCLSVRDAFLEHAGWDVLRAFDADRFDLDLVTKVEPALPYDAPVVLKDYPAEVAALARRSAVDPQVAERWELYIGGLELANAFSELADPKEQRVRFEVCARERSAMGKPVYQLDEEFLRALEKGMPPSGGIALGVDRLVMLFTDSARIEDVRTFCEATD